MFNVVFGEIFFVFISNMEHDILPYECVTGPGHSIKSMRNVYMHSRYGSEITQGFRKKQVCCVSLREESWLSTVIGKQDKVV